ncbi:MAG: hypothetical protein K5894_10730 [Lachnospiraceae bacterium]|nr:hypothetical protein [Lachnospiraceae bacterium]
MNKKLFEELYENLNILYKKYENMNNKDVCKDILLLKKIIEKNIDDMNEQQNYLDEEEYIRRLCISVNQNK